MNYRINKELLMITQKQLNSIPNFISLTQTAALL